MIKPNTLKPIEIGFGESKVIFHLRMISVAEEDAVQQKFNDISDSDTDKWQKQYDVCRDALGEFSVEMPQTLLKEKAEFKRVPLVEAAETPTAAIDVFFKERTIENERTIRDAFWLFKSQLASESRFL
jgi:hypothetical protein